MTLVVSFALHAALALVLVGLPGESVTEAPEQQVALVWAEQAPGAGDAADSAPQSAEALPREQPAAPPSSGTEAAPATVPEAEPEPPTETAERDPVPEAAVPPPLPPPPAPPTPPRPSRPTPARSAPPEPAVTGSAPATPPMARGAGQALGAVVPARLRPGAVNAPPAYPQASRLRNEQGRVTLQVAIDTTGQATDVRVMVSSGYPALDQAAIEAVRRWRFEAARRNGQPVLSTTAIGITFQLEGDRRW